MGDKYVCYDHFGNGSKQWVREDLKGKHREHCLCFNCEKFNPEEREGNCPIANILYSICVAHNIVTPVWECPEFVEKCDDGGEDTNGD